MRISQRLKRKIKSKILISLSIVTVILSIFVVDKQTNSIYKLIKENITKTEVAQVASESADTYELNYKNDYIKVGTTYQYKIMDEEGQEQSVNMSDWTWTSSNEDVATINSNGIVTGKGIGHTTITGHNSETGLKTKAIINVYRNVEGAITVPQVEEGEGFTIVLKEDGTVWSAGKNNYGQLGDGTTINKNTPVQVKIDENTFLTNVKKIACFEKDIIALTKDGEIYGWGANAYGQLGQGNTTYLKYATRMKGIDGEGYLENIIEIDMSDDAAYLVDKDGNLFGCGGGLSYQLMGKERTSTPVKLEKMTNVITVSGGYSDAAVILTNGETWVWARNLYGELGIKASEYEKERCIGTDINDFKSDGWSSYLLKEDKTIWSSGYNNYGQLGLGDTTNRSEFTQVKFEDGTEAKAKSIIPGARNFQFIGTDGKVYVIGYNGYGQLSDGTTTNATYPISMKNADGTEITDAILLVDGGRCYYSNDPCNMGIIRNNGTIWLSGDNTYGQIGNKNNTSTTYVTQVGTPVIKLNARNEYIKIAETLDVDVLDALSLNVFIQEEIDQSDWTWTSSNEDVATIDNNGVITGKGIGNITITGYNSKEGLKAKAIINVYRNVEGAITIPQVEEGEGFTIVLKEDGTVWATGRNNYGQLGDGTTTNKNTFAQVKIDKDTYLTNVKKIASFDGDTIALTQDGEVYVWGRNNYGQLGQGNTTSLKYATKMKGINGEGYINNIIEMDMSDNTTYLVDKDGNLFGCGGGESYQLMGKGIKYTPIKLEAIKNIISVNAGYSDASVILADGETWVWARNRYGQLGVTASSYEKERCIGTDINDIKFDGWSSYLLKEDKTIWSSGYNNYGQLGLGDTTNRSEFTQVKFEDGTEAKAKSIIPGARNFEFIGTDGKVYVTGYNGYSQLSDGTTTNSSYPIVMKNADGTEVTDAVLLVDGGRSYYSNDPRNMGIIRNDGTIWITGDNTYGQIGDGTNNSSKYLTKLGNDNTELNAKNEYIKIGETLDIDVLNQSGFNVFIQEESKESDWTWTSSNEDVAAIDSNGVATGKGVGHTTITGYNSKVGIKARAIINVYRNVEGAITVPQVEMGDGFTIVLKEDGTVWSSGLNSVGQLGDGTKTNKNTPARVKIDENTYLENVIKISAFNTSSGTNGYAMALTKDGEIYAWGANNRGQLGQGNTTNLTYATKVKGVGGESYLSDIIDIGTLTFTSFAIGKNGEVYGWGTDQYLLTTGTTYYPKVQKMSNTIKLVVAYDGAAEMLQNGKTIIWGENKYGENGTGITTNPTEITYLSNDIVEIETKGYSTYLLKEDGTIWATGLNNYGQLGDGTTINRNTYQQVKYENGEEVKAKTIKASDRNLQFIGTDGKVHVTGCNNYGQLGNGNSTNSLNPVKVEGLTNIIKVDAYKYMTIALNENGEVFVWGNGYGTTPKKLQFSKKVIDIAGNIVLEENRRAYDLNEKVSYGRDLIKISAGENHYLGLDSNGEVYAWGTNNYGQLGNGNNISSNIPSKVVTPDGTANISDIVEISAGNQYSIISDKDGNVYTFGNNSYNKLAGGNTRNTPLKIEDLSKIELVSASEGSHTAIVDWDGYVYTVGLNDAGQLGLKDNTQRSTFEMVGELQIECEPTQTI